MQTDIEWWPQDRQLVAIEAAGLDEPFTDKPLHPAIADIIGYGGAAGGGKTDTLLQVGLIACLKYPGIGVAYFRREFPQLEGTGGAISRSIEMFHGIGNYNQQSHKWTFPGNSTLQFYHCKDPLDVYNYQSQQFDIELIDEVTQFTEEMVKYLLTRNRATINAATFKPFAMFATNPGNVGHQYFFHEFVEPGDYERVHTFTTETGSKETHIFIPAKLFDNQILVKRDPGYANRVANTELNKQMLLEGRWDIFVGQAFSELSRNIHLIPPFTIPDEWMRAGSYDHGFNHPYSFGLFAVSPKEDVYLIKHVSSRLRRIDEIHRTMKEVTGGINKLKYIVAGKDIWSRQKDGGPTIAEQFSKKKPPIFFRPAKTDRVQGAAQVREYISWKGTKDDGTDGTPKFYIFETGTNVDVYNTLVGMQFDPNNGEDVMKKNADENGKGGDDNYDMVRYFLMSRPRPSVLAERKAPRDSFAAWLQKKKLDKWKRNHLVGWNLPTY